MFDFTDEGLLSYICCHYSTVFPLNNVFVKRYLHEDDVYIWGHNLHCGVLIIIDAVSKSRIMTWNTNIIP